MLARAVGLEPSVRALLNNPQIPLYITEGIRKGDAAISQGLCCIALLGVTNWRGTNASGGKTAYLFLDGCGVSARGCTADRRPPRSPTTTGRP